MDAHPSPSPPPATTLRLPGVIVGLVAYGAFLLICHVPSFVPTAGWVQNYWAELPFGISRFLTTIALFIAAFVINEKRAFLVPVCGAIGLTILLHYLRDYPAQWSDQGVNVPGLWEELWRTIRNDVVVGLMIVGLALAAARFWAPRVEDRPGRVIVPPVRPALTLCVASLAISEVLIWITSHGHLTFYPMHAVITAIDSFAVISAFCLGIVAFSPWTALLWLALLFQNVTLFFLEPDQCAIGGLGSCWDVIEPIVRSEFITVAVLYVISIAAARWAREGEITAAEEPSAGLDAAPA